MSFLNKIGAFFKKIFGNTEWERTVSVTLTVIAPLLNSVVTLAAGEAAAAQVAAIVKEVQNDLAATAALLQHVQQPGPFGSAAPDTVFNLLNGAKDHLSELLTAGHIKNPDTQKKVSIAVTTIVDEINAVISAIPKAPQPVLTPAK